MSIFDLELNEHGTLVAKGVCNECGRPFTVTPPPNDWDSWGGEICLDKLCPSYDPDRDADRYFEKGAE